MTREDFACWSEAGGLSRQTETLAAEVAVMVKPSQRIFASEQIETVMKTILQYQTRLFGFEQLHLFRK